MIAYFARHPTAANLLMLGFLAAGLLSIGKLRRETFPDFRPTEVEIRVRHPGATAEEVEESVCQRLEDALDGVRFVDEVRSDARQGLGIVTLRMLPRGNYQAFKDEIDTAVAAVDDFPAGSDVPIITQLHTTDLVLSVLVTGPMPPTHLKTYCEDLKRRLEQQPDISLVRIHGFSDRQLRVELFDEALRRYGLNAAEVAEIVRRQSLNLPAGTVEARDTELTLRFVEERRSPRELEDLVIVAGLGGAEIRLGDLGRVVDRFEHEEDQVRFADRQAGLLNIEMTRDQDVIRRADAVKRFLEEERQRYPQLTFEITQDTSTLVEGRLKLLVTNGMQGMLLVFLTLWLFFNLRLSFWVVMSLPVSFLGAFFFVSYLGLTLNMMTMLGLLLALGILMDDGIVVAENIAAHRARGKPAIQAAVDGVGEVKAGVFSSFITTVCVLGPLAFLEGDIGAVLEVIPIILILVLVVSLIEVYCILPAHLGHSLHHYDPDNANRFRRTFDRWIEWTRERVVGRSVDVLLRWRYAWIGTVVGLFLVSIGLVAGGVVKFQAFPDLDGDVIEARLVLPQGTPLARTEEVVRRLTGALERVNARFVPVQPEGQDLVRTVYVRFNQNPDAFENGPHVATVTADLLTAERRNARLDDVFAAWREEVGEPPDVVSLAYTEPGFGPKGRSIDIRIQGDDLEELKTAATEMQQWLSGFAGVSNLSDDLRVGRPELRVRLLEGAFGLGLDAEGMARQLRAAFQGVTADTIQVGPESYEIDVRLAREDRDNLTAFEQFQFTLPDGRQIPLTAVTKVDPDRGWSRIARVNGLRTVTVRGDVDSQRTNTIALVGQMQRDFLPELRTKYPGVAVSFEGEPKEGATTRASIFRGMLVGLLGVFILLSFQFRSYLEPLVVMVAIPLALIGVVAGHLIMGISLSMPSILGFVSLAGIVVNDSILLVLFLKQRRDEGADVLDSARLASRQRFRAIVLTSLTTIAGLLPLLAERSLQAQVLIPLASSIAFGLMASTVLVLLVIPSLYLILADFGLIEKRASDREAAEGAIAG
ncbi:MAG: efflux RND transporter permease subunit [Thermoguttaceae bacterium]|jgi:multidrug efflux pump subunit AcrB|nr:efflux RND transporter permease subunit [Thermoguttaceae bacterium]